MVAPDLGTEAVAGRALCGDCADVSDALIAPSSVPFDFTEAFPLTAVDAPADAGPLPVVEPPVITPEGTAIRLVSRAKPGELVQTIPEDV